MRFSYYKTANHTASCSVVWCSALLLVVQLCHFAGSFGVVFTVCTVWWTLLVLIVDEERESEVKREKLLWVKEKRSRKRVKWIKNWIMLDLKWKIKKRSVRWVVKYVFFIYILNLSMNALIIWLLFKKIKVRR